MLSSSAQKLFPESCGAIFDLNACHVQAGRNFFLTHSTNKFSPEFFPEAKENRTVAAARPPLQIDIVPK